MKKKKTKTYCHNAMNPQMSFLSLSFFFFKKINTLPQIRKLIPSLFITPTNSNLNFKQKQETNKKIYSHLYTSSYLIKENYYFQSNSLICHITLSSIQHQTQPAPTYHYLLFPIRLLFSFTPQYALYPHSLSLQIQINPPSDRN